MESLRSPSYAESSGYVSWEEVKSDKGRREIRYYLKRIDGGLDLAVVGKEKSLKHISYRYVVKNTLPLFSLVPSLKPKSRREVIDWLNSIVSDSLPSEPSDLSRPLDNSDSSELDIENFKVMQLQKLGHYTKEFSWLGSPWTCRKRRKHYQSFRRNGFKISVHDFVYVLAEEDNRLVAYLEDMYEDSKSNKMVVVRWFHKIDEVGIALPRKFNDREIFFSLCLQDLSVECIDGMATVLSPQHFEKFLKEARHTMLDPFVCYKQFDNEDVRPFDITRVKGYWKQEILRYMHMASPDKSPENFQEGLNFEADVNDDYGVRPRKRHCPSNNIDVHIGVKESSGAMVVNTHNVRESWINSRSGMENCSLKGGESASLLSKTESKRNPSEYLKVGSEVEVLSQDSGIRGCWFRALIIKRHKDKVKVRYQDLKDADNEANNLEEWILSNRVAVPDQLGIRISGRSMIRPTPKCNKAGVSCAIDVGIAVDVWWHDVWQEGVIVKKESEDRFHVYFPGEKQDSVFGRDELRISQEWLGNRWIQIRERPDIVTSTSSVHEIKQDVRTDEIKSIETAICDTRKLEQTKAVSKDYSSGSGCERGRDTVFCDLSKDSFLGQLRWNSLKKRRRSSGSSCQRVHHKSNGSKSWKEVIGSSACESFLLPITLKVDNDNCKYMRDSLFGSAVSQPLTSLVMSR